MRDWHQDVRAARERLGFAREREAEVEEEMAQHLASRYEDARGGGASEDEAVRMALDELEAWTGRSESLTLRRRWSARLRAATGDLGDDLRFGARVLRRNLGFASAAVVALALGIGLNTAVFTVVHATLMAPLPVRDASRLVLVWESLPEAGVPRLPFSPPDLETLQRHQRSFSSVAAFGNTRHDVSGGGDAERVTGARVEPPLFATVGIAPALGRPFSPEDVRDRARVVVLSHGFWQRRFAADPGVLGRTLAVDRIPHLVIGVMPPGFRFPLAGPAFNNDPADIFLPLAFTPQERAAYGGMYNKSVLARLQEGVTLDEARAEMAALGSEIQKAYPADVMQAFGQAPLRIDATPLTDEVVGSTRRPLLVLTAAVALVLLIACANVACLLLSRAAAREKEMAVRAALGAGRSRLVRQLLAESLAIALFGGAAGLGLAYLALALARTTLPQDVPLQVPAGLDGAVLAVTLLTCAACAFVFGVVPALSLVRSQLTPSLRQAGRGATATPARRRLQDAFIVAQFALALILMTGAGLLVRSLMRLLDTDPGFRPHSALAASITLPPAAYPMAGDVRALYARLLERLAAQPGVVAVGAATDLPLEATEYRMYRVETSSGEDMAKTAVAQSWITGRYLEAVGVDVLKGRGLGPGDRAGSLPVVLVSESLARRMWPGQEAIGRRLRLGGGGAPWLSIVGVVRDVKDGPLQAPAQDHTYTTLEQADDADVANAIVGQLRSVNVVVRTDGDPAALAGSLRRTLREIDPELALARVRALEDDVRAITAPQRANAYVLAGFGLAALILAAVGIYGVMAYAVGQQTREIGVRMAMGARARDVLRMVGLSGLRLAALGMALGALGALAVTRLLASLLHGVTPTDPVTFAVVSMVLAGVAAVACYGPARRATRIDPLVALREE
jgi:putative ABC transport system permease protein